MSLKTIHSIISKIGIGIGILYVISLFNFSLFYNMHYLWPYVCTLFLIILIALLILEILQYIKFHHIKKSTIINQTISYLMSISCIIPTILFFTLTRAGTGWEIQRQLGLLKTINIFFTLILFYTFISNIKKDYKTGLLPFIFAIFGWVSMLTTYIGA